MVSGRYEINGWRSAEGPVAVETEFRVGTAAQLKARTSLQSGAIFPLISIDRYGICF
jgi:hypothetical protein